MKSLMGRAMNIMTRTATTIAATMTGKCFAKPTAVNTESRENTISTMAI